MLDSKGEINMKYTETDLKNIIALCEQDGQENGVPARLAKRCRNALAYQDLTMRLTKNDKVYLSSIYDESMDADAMETLKRILA